MKDLSAIWIPFADRRAGPQALLPRSMVTSRNYRMKNTLGVNVLAVNKKDEISWKSKNITLKQGCIYWLSFRHVSYFRRRNGAKTGCDSGYTLCCATALRHIMARVCAAVVQCLFRRRFALGYRCVGAKQHAVG
ncbi:hypothetical protein ACFWP0_19135 [Achromobacter sp. NPDC058515]|uniref:hypothetical protein n=1 Tax=Achromobacter sp. NPDC058515 TaxID=3346533 RepID=UPI00364866F9